MGLLSILCLAVHFAATCFQIPNLIVTFLRYIISNLEICNAMFDAFIIVIYY